jgi:four helix bundle protein
VYGGMGAARYEELRVWQAAREFSRNVATLFERGTFRRDFHLCNQLNDASGSTMANIAEGFLRHRDREFAYFLRVAAGSNGEARSHLYVAHDRGYLTDTDLQRLIEKTNQIGRMLRALERTLHV